MIQGCVNIQIVLLIFDHFDVFLVLGQTFNVPSVFGSQSGQYFRLVQQTLFSTLTRSNDIDSGLRKRERVRERDREREGERELRPFSSGKNWFLKQRLLLQKRP